MTSNNETVHVSFGNTANHITSHLLNLQGLAATTNNSGGNESSNNNNNESSASGKFLQFDVINFSDEAQHIIISAVCSSTLSTLIIKS